MADVILVIDDDLVIQKAVTKLLRDQFYDVQVAGTLAEARTILAARQISMILVDLRLPDGSGTDILEYARRIDDRIAVVVLTSSTQTDSVVEAIRKGAFDYLAKPIDRGRLVGVVEKALAERGELNRRHASPPPAHVLVMDDDLVLLKVMSNWLAGLGCIIYQASHLAEADQIMGEAPIDLVISDVYLEQGTGLDLARKLKKQDDPPLILVTSARDTGTAINALREGAFDYLQKPIEKTDFVNSVLRARQFREAMKQKVRLEREKEEYRVKLELLTAGLEAKVREQVDEIVRAQSFVSSIYKSLPSGILVTDRKMKVTAINPAGETILGTPADLVVGRQVGEHGKVASFASTINEVLRGGKTFADLQAEIPNSSGPTRLLGYTVAPLVSSAGNDVLGTITHFTDVTSRLMLEEYKAQSERLVSLGMMAGGMAHEINNPLTVIVGWLEHILEQQKVSASVEEALRKCLHSAMRCGELVGAMLSLSRRSATKVSRVDVHAALRRVAGLIEKQLSIHHVEFISQLAAAHPTVMGEERELEQLFLNLFLNARDAMPHGGKLFVSTQTEGDDVIIRIADTGVGIQKERLPRLFTPFYTTKDVGKGTGLGLAICLAIVERHRGRIDASSEVGRGTTITVCIPVTASLHDSPVSDLGPVPNLPPLRIVVVDDDSAVLELCAAHLRGGHHQVYPFQSGLACLEWLADNTPDLVIMDVKMPTMDGVDLYCRIQELRPGTVSLFITGSVVGKSLEALRSHGRLPIRVVRKPFRMETLLRAIGGALQAKDPGKHDYSLHTE